MNFQQTELIKSALDPVYFMRNYVKVRSSASESLDTLDDVSESEENDVQSTIELLNPWPKQEELIRALLEHHMIIGPKSRKIGFTTVGIGFGIWGQTFWPNSRIHYMSRGDAAAMNLIERHKFSYRRLPDWMRLPISVSNTHTFTVRGDDGAERTVQAYPATEDTAIEETADYTLLDEFASIREPLASRLWAGVEPTIAPNGYCLMISRGKGPQGTFARLVRQAAAREGLSLLMEVL